MQARIAASEQALEAERTAHEATRSAVKLTTLQIEKLKVQLSRLRRMKFGQSSERITEMADQLELTLEDLEAEHAHAACAIREPAPTEERASMARAPKRLPLPKHLPREDMVHVATGRWLFRLWRHHGQAGPRLLVGARRRIEVC